ncbi:MAG TPA: DUF3352 domain-containing protein [Solirubrobacterales bacterium]|nr:DUF3352 domain-containing protein [Solirubrobacterales bacterium]
MKSRLVLPVLLAALLALAVAGCGGGGDSAGGGDAAELAPPKAPLFISFVVQPEGEMKTNIEDLAQRLAGVDLGQLIVSELEKSAAEDGEEFDFSKEVEPWLGERAGFFAQDFDGEDFHHYGVAIEVTDEGEASDFVDKITEKEDEPAKDGSYEGVDFKVAADDGSTVGVFDGFLAVAEDEATFKQMVDSSEGEALAGEDTYTSAVGNVPGGSADVYVDIGALIDEAGSEIEPDTQLFLDSVGIEPDEATAVASLIPGSDQIEIDLSTDLSGENPPSGDASKLLEALPGDSVIAFASPEFGKRFQEGIDQIDENGIPGQVPPHQLKKALKQSGVNLDSITGGIGDVGLFVRGGSQRDLGGALVLETEDPKQAANTVSNIGLFLRASGTPGVTAISSEGASGFSVRSPELGRQPLIVAAKGSHMAVAYGAAAAAAALAEGGETLADNPAYKEAVSALGGTPASGFVDGHAALKLVSSLVPSYQEGFSEAKPYLTKIDYVALGAEASDGLAVAKLIVGVGK